MNPNKINPPYMDWFLKWLPILLIDCLLSGNIFKISFCIKNAVINQIGQKIKFSWLIKAQIAKREEVKK